MVAGNDPVVLRCQARDLHLCSFDMRVAKLRDGK